MHIQWLTYRLCNFVPRYKCWMLRAEERPTFAVLQQGLEALLDAAEGGGAKAVRLFSFFLLPFFLSVSFESKVWHWSSHAS